MRARTLHRARSLGTKKGTHKAPIGFWIWDFGVGGFRANGGKLILAWAFVCMCLCFLREAASRHKARRPAERFLQGSIWVWLNMKKEGFCRFWSMFPLTRVPFWYRSFEPQPFGHAP